MDLNDDGHIDVLSGSYSRMTRDMAGLFQVLWGSEDGFLEASTVVGTDFAPLIISAPGEDNITARICTRATAADLDADGDLDIVAGNFVGSFALFEGHGQGRFEPHSTFLESGNSSLYVAGHSDPFLVDWDGDGDLDLLSGSARGGVYLCVNSGTAEQASFEQPVALVPAAEHGDDEMVFGDAHLTGPATDTRVWADDLDGDGKLDLLVGDSVTLRYPAEGIDAATCVARLTAWQTKEEALMDSLERNGDAPPSAAAMEKFNAAYTALHEERDAFLRTDSTGFVWAYYQK